MPKLTNKTRLIASVNAWVKLQYVMKIYHERKQITAIEYDNFLNLVIRNINKLLDNYLKEKHTNVR